eukprot:139107-Amphidinium_carterae.1
MASCFYADFRMQVLIVGQTRMLCDAPNQHALGCPCATWRAAMVARDHKLYSLPPPQSSKTTQTEMRDKGNVGGGGGGTIL